LTWPVMLKMRHRVKTLRSPMTLSNSHVS
jgi:hypothetical protein